MCDPVTLSIASTVVGAAGSAMNAMGQANAQKKQKQEVEIWQEKQRANRNAENVRQEAMRKQAEAGRQKGVEDISIQSQQERQAAEEARLAASLAGDNPESDAGVESGGVPLSVADTSLLSGQQAGDATFQEAAAKKIGEATSNARKRIAAMAKVASYGGTAGGLATTNKEALARSGAAIDAQNEFRRGSLGAFGLERAVEPVQVQFTPSPLANIFSAALSAGAQGLGNAYGNPFMGNPNPTYPQAPVPVPMPRPVHRTSPMERFGGIF
jgi:hypothetical protein